LSRSSKRLAWKFSVRPGVLSSAAAARRMTGQAHEFTARKAWSATGVGLGTLGLGSNGDGYRSVLSGPAIAPRVSTGAVASSGGTLPRLIEGLLEAVRTAPMDVKERAAAALHSLAEQAKESAELIGKSDGVPSLIQLLNIGSPDAQAHAAAGIAGVTRISKELQVCACERVSSALHRCGTVCCRGRPVCGTCAHVEQRAVPPSRRERTSVEHERVTAQGVAGVAGVVTQ
jgi:hypothetical protein